MSGQSEVATEPATDVLAMLEEDHRRVKDLFERFERTDETDQREEILKTALHELEVHAELEEKLIYPAFRDHLEEPDLIDEALEEHHVVHLLIKELKGGRGRQQRRNAKFLVLAENVKHHIKEEEDSLFPKVENLELDWENLASRVTKKKTQLESRGRRSNR